MSDWTQPMSRLQAVNVCLSAMGESKVESVDAGGLDAQLANELIDETSANLQGKDWYWNREFHQLSPDTNGFIWLPNNIIWADTYGPSANVDVVPRGLQLFNVTDSTYVFTDPLYVELRVHLEWDLLPFSARRFIAASAAMALQQRVLSSDSIDKMLAKHASDAWVDLVRTESKIADANMLKDNWSSAGVVNRGMFRRGLYL